MLLLQENSDFGLGEERENGFGWATNSVGHRVLAPATLWMPCGFFSPGQLGLCLLDPKVQVIVSGPGLLLASCQSVVMMFPVHLAFCSDKGGGPMSRLDREGVSEAHFCHLACATWHQGWMSLLWDK
jgi:hypothetical protein